MKQTHPAERHRINPVNAGIPPPDLIKQSPFNHPGRKAKSLFEQGSGIILEEGIYPCYSTFPGLPASFGQRHCAQFKHNNAPGQTLADVFQQGKILGTGEKILPRPVIAINQAFDNRQKFRSILNLVKNDWRQILRKEKLGILPGIANVHHRIKNNVPDSRVQDMSKQCAFTGLPRPR